MELNPNSLAFIGLSNEFCTAVENVGQNSLNEFVATMVRLLPRLYISASDLKIDTILNEDDAFVDSYLDEEYYESLRSLMASLFGSEDVYLDVFEEDMKYSDTPIGMSISEGLSDIFQVLYNFVMTVKDSPTEAIAGALMAVKDDFADYWAQKLCNLMRPLNALYFANHDEDDEY